MEALALFNMMRENGFSEDFSTVFSLLCACTCIGGLGHGKQLHAHACKLGVSKDVIVSTSLIDMYSKCGSVDDGRQLFRELEFCDTILLNSMINVYCNSGKVQDHLALFNICTFLIDFYCKCGCVDLGRLENCLPDGES
ncbi:hypothetical protein Dimus_037628 [Dionaea muscipula]